MELVFLILFIGLLAGGLYLASKVEHIVDTAKERAEEIIALQMENAQLRAENTQLKEIIISKTDKGE